MDYIYDLLTQNMLFRLGSGLIPLFPMMVIFHTILLILNRRPGIKTPVPHIAGVYVFCFTLVFILVSTSVPGLFHNSFEPIINLIPFADISFNGLHYLVNMLLFIPMGFLLPALWLKFEKKRLTFPYGLFFSLSIELIQLFNNRISDIDDLIMNTAGIVLGYYLFILIKRLLPKISALTIDKTNHWKWEPYFCFLSVWLSMLFFRHYATYWLFSLN